jgi:hypothetical protein
MLALAICRVSGARLALVRPAAMFVAEQRLVSSIPSSGKVRRDEDGWPLASGISRIRLFMQRAHVCQAKFDQLIHVTLPCRRESRNVIADPDSQFFASQAVQARLNWGRFHNLINNFIHENTPAQRFCNAAFPRFESQYSFRTLAEYFWLSAPVSGAVFPVSAAANAAAIRQMFNRA